MRRRQRGQSLAEFAIVFPIFMFMLGGAIQFGVIFWGQNSLNQAIRDAGRYAVTQQNCAAASVQAVRDNVATLVQSTGVATLTGSATVTMPTNGESVGTGTDPVSDACPSTKNSDHVWVRITAAAQVPIFFPFVPGNGNISTTALFRMEPAVTP